ncbi:hypothetical protein CCACVL1_21429 [Corchorus capsularis]|uniref:Uncharacterized protein n=1 Tax=Corchorus capsularis TaxID=210143 RepID=A0A1R3H5T7_COCAP|nr:hypothetical protein CCACVL1_21429 [Corchorus capsularis]
MEIENERQSMKQLKDVFHEHHQPLVFNKEAWDPKCYRSIGPSFQLLTPSDAIPCEPPQLSSKPIPPNPKTLDPNPTIFGRTRPNYH